MENEPKDLKDCEDKSPNAKDPFKSVTTEEAKKDLKRVLGEITYRDMSEVKKFLPMAEKYKKAWKTIYSSLPEWRRKEIDKQMESGKLSDKNWDTNFVRRVASLVESDDPQEAG